MPLVLVVDDIGEELYRTASALRQAHIDVTPTTRWEETIDLARRLNPDAVVLDLNLDGVLERGLALCLELRTARPGRPVILFTVLSREQESKAIFVYRASVYVRKGDPGAYETLVAYVRRLIEQGTGRGALCRLSSGPLHLDRLNRRATPGG
jgi:DNA-binding response OmpR family regulator